MMAALSKLVTACTVCLAGPVFAQDAAECERAWTVLDRAFVDTPYAELHAKDVEAGAFRGEGDLPLTEGETRFLRASAAFLEVQQALASNASQSIADVDEKSATLLMPSSFVMTCNPPTRALYSANGSDITSFVFAAALRLSLSEGIKQHPQIWEEQF